MKHISEVRNTKLDPSRSETRFSEREQRLISWVWAKLTAKYGNLWTSQIADPRLNAITQAEWVEKLSRYSGESIRKVVDSWEEEFPPTLPKLLERLKPTAAMHKIYKTLPRPTSSPVVARAYIEDIKKALREVKPEGGGSTQEAQERMLSQMEEALR
jgi:hypothetical protein